MRLGEIKVQALSLMYPDTPIRYSDGSDEEINDALYELKSNPNFEGVLESCVGSINRAFAQIESLGLSTKRCVDFGISCLERAQDGRVIISPPTDLYSVDRVLCHKGELTYACGHETVNGAVYADYMPKGVYTLVYRTKIPRIKRTTADSYQVELPLGICDGIPYFVASELLAGEDSDRAKEARQTFEGALERAGKRDVSCNECFQIIYSVVDL